MSDTQLVIGLYAVLFAMTAYQVLHDVVRDLVRMHRRHRIMARRGAR